MLHNMLQLKLVVCLLPDLRAVCPCHALHATLTVGHCIVRVNCPLHLAAVRLLVR